METNFTPFPVLTTEHLVLRQIESTDDKDIFSHRSDPRVNKYLDGFSHASIDQTHAFIEAIQQNLSTGKSIFWVITKKGDNKFIGTICLWNISQDEDKAETGYTLDPGFHGKGYMTEALEKVIDFGFNKMKLKTIEAHTHKDNESSIRLLLKTKFKLVTTAGTGDEQVDDNIIFALANEETKANR